MTLWFAFVNFRLQSSAESSKAKSGIMNRPSSREEDTFVSELQRTFKLDKTKLIRALDLLRPLDTSLVDALGQLDSAIVRRALAGNYEAEKLGDRILRRLTGFFQARRKNPPSSSGKISTSSGKIPTSSSAGGSRGGAEKRRAGDGYFESNRPPQKMPRTFESRRGGSPGFSQPRGPPPSRFDMRRPLIGSSQMHMNERELREWNNPPSRGGMMRGGFPRGSGYRPPARGRYGHEPYYWVANVTALLELWHGCISFCDLFGVHSSFWRRTN